MGLNRHYKTFLIGYELPVYKSKLYFIEDRGNLPFQYHRNKNGKIFKQFDKEKCI